MNVRRLGNKTGADGAILISESLKRNTTLTSLFLGSEELNETIIHWEGYLTEWIWTDNRIGDGGGVAISELLRMLSNTTLTELNLCGNDNSAKCVLTYWNVLDLNREQYWKGGSKDDNWSTED